MAYENHAWKERVAVWANNHSAVLAFFVINDEIIDVFVGSDNAVLYIFNYVHRVVVHHQYTITRARQ